MGTPLLTSEEVAKQKARLLLNRGVSGNRSKSELKCHRCKGTFPAEDVTKFKRDRQVVHRCKTCQEEKPYAPRIIAKPSEPETTEKHEIQVSGQVSRGMALKILKEARVSKDMIGAVIENLKEQGIIEKSGIERAQDVYKEIAVMLKGDDEIMKLVNAMRDAFIDHMTETTVN